MGETQATIAYGPKDLAEVLVRHSDIHEGHWGIQIEFAFTAGIFPIATQEKVTVLPGAISAVSKIGIHRFEEPNPLTVDASKINPLASADQPRHKVTKEKKD